MRSILNNLPYKTKVCIVICLAVIVNVEIIAKELKIDSDIMTYTIKTDDIDRDGRADIYYEDEEKILVWKSSQGGTLAELKLKKGQNFTKNILTQPLGVKVKDKSLVYFQDKTVGKNEVLYQGKDLVVIRTTSGDFHGYIEQYVTIKPDQIHLLMNFNATQDFATTDPKKPYENYIKLVTTVDPKTFNGTGFICDNKFTSESRYAYKSIVLKSKSDNGFGLHWIYPAMTVMVKENTNGVDIELTKCGFTPKAGQIWQIECVLTAGADITSKGRVHIESPKLPLWIQTPVDTSHWLEGDQEKYDHLKKLLPCFQEELNGTEVEGGISRFPSLGAEPFAQSFDGATALIAFDRVGMHDRAEKGFKFFRKSQNKDGSWYLEMNKDGTVKHNAKLLLSGGEIVMAAYNHYQFTKDMDFLSQYHDMVVSALEYIMTKQDAVTGFIHGPMDSYSEACISANALECGWRICEILKDASNAEKFRTASLRAAILIHGLAFDGPNAIEHAYCWESPIKARIGWDHYNVMWYQSVWDRYTGPGGMRANVDAHYGSGETAELARGTFWNKQKQKDLMAGMYKWAWQGEPMEKSWIKDTEPLGPYGIGGFVDSSAPWVGTNELKGYSDRLVWAQTEPLIYLTTDFRSYNIDISKPYHINPLVSGQKQNVSVRVLERRGNGIKHVQINYGDGWKDMAARGFTYVYSWISSVVGKVDYQVRVTDLQSNIETVAGCFVVVQKSSETDKGNSP